eukprot:9435803-Lingulodinium_polyedra.AAC.1
MDVRRWSLLPDVLAYMSLINACENAQRRKQVLSLFLLMQQIRLQPSVVTFNVSISAQRFWEQRAVGVGAEASEGNTAACCPA